MVSLWSSLYSPFHLAFCWYARAGFPRCEISPESPFKHKKAKAGRSWLTSCANKFQVPSGLRGATVARALCVLLSSCLLGVRNLEQRISSLV